MVLTIQREFAERLAAEPRTKDYGALTLLVQRRWQVKYLRTIPPSVFMPRPKVDSAAILLTPRPAGPLTDCDARRFTALVKQGFSQRRKQLGKLLGDPGLGRNGPGAWGERHGTCGGTDAGAVGGVDEPEHRAKER